MLVDSPATFSNSSRKATSHTHTHAGHFVRWPTLAKYTKKKKEVVFYISLYESTKALLKHAVFVLCCHSLIHLSTRSNGAAIVLVFGEIISLLEQFYGLKKNATRKLPLKQW